MPPVGIPRHRFAVVVGLAVSACASTDYHAESQHSSRILTPPPPAPPEVRLEFASLTTLPSYGVGWNLPEKPESISHRRGYARIEYEAGNTVAVDGRAYTLREIQVRAPSPITVDRRSAPLELRFIAKDADWNTVWVSVPVGYGRRNPAAGTLLGKLPPMMGHAAHLRMLTIDSMQLVPSNYSTGYFAEGDRERQWYVIDEPVEWSQDQVRDFARILANG